MSAEESEILGFYLSYASQIALLTAILVVVLGGGIGFIWLMVTRSGKPQELLDKGLVGETARALTPIGPREGRVEWRGKNLRAISEHPIKAGDEVRVIAADGMSLAVAPAAGAPGVVAPASGAPTAKPFEESTFPGGPPPADSKEDVLTSDSKPTTDDDWGL